MTPISPLNKDGFTVDGTGYFACHQESHRVLYARTPWCRVAVTASLAGFSLAGVVLGLIYGAPAAVLLGAALIAGMVWRFAPKKTCRPATP